MWLKCNVFLRPLKIVERSTVQALVGRDPSRFRVLVCYTCAAAGADHDSNATRPHLRQKQPKRRVDWIGNESAPHCPMAPIMPPMPLPGFRHLHRKCWSAKALRIISTLDFRIHFGLPWCHDPTPPSQDVVRPLASPYTSPTPSRTETAPQQATAVAVGLLTERGERVCAARSATSSTSRT